ncbi:rhamnogalacturonan acetylesterase [Sphingomonas sp. M1-B02]|uniref:rhamnogalacturonan acetylesterase n=1 Tax=Sphingomonas sp. M1-B02 TaxID=3114300 RepID=UPI00223FBA60|nr:rhamnogalacturonan acetylesterase [Sphingomonas sp. S6-11]UZK67320.1 rhamnogalacturonan acetylesterase [Sphingomonas sp. S6-11]
MLAPYIASLAAIVAIACSPAASAQSFSFGPGAPASTRVYTAEAGYGFEGAVPQIGKDSVGGQPFFFSVDVPEGNYRVTVTFGGDRASETTARAELRRLMLERVRVPARGSATRSFIVNVRTPDFPGGRVKLKRPREVETEARAWDKRVTLEFAGTPAVRAIKVEPVTVPTIYILGDSTVADQSGEPFASWGQMFPRFFKPTVAVANHSESGESTLSATGAGRFEKILSLIRPGDTFIVQFGHNDQKAKAPDKEDKYKAILVDWARRVKAKGATLVIVTPMHRNRMIGGKVQDTLGNFPELARAAAAESGALLIDLHAKSRILYEALGPQGTNALFEHNADYSQKDGTHHGPYGAYELAKIVVQGLRDANAPIASEVLTDFERYDPARPLAEKNFKVPPSHTFASERPLGDN